MIYLGAVILVTLVGVWASGVTESTGGISDPSYVVIDEVAGQLITLFLTSIFMENFDRRLFLI